MEAILPRSPAPRNAAVERLAGTGKVLLFGREPGPWEIRSYLHEGAKPRRQMRVKYQKAKAVFDQRVTDCINHKAKAQNLSPAQIAEYLACEKENQPTGRPLLDAVGFAAHLQRELPGMSREEIVRQIKAMRPKAGAPAKVKIICGELIESVQQDGNGERWVNTLRAMLDRVSAWFDCEIHTITTADADDWLRKLKLGIVSRKNYRAALVQLERFAISKNYVPADWKNFSTIKRLELPDLEITAMLPKQLELLLDAATERARIAIAFQAFTGVRTEELCPPGDGPRLQWQNVALVRDDKGNIIRRNIYVPKNVGKEGARNIPICDGLIPWIDQYRKNSGPICTLSVLPDAIVRAKARAGLPAGKNQTRNILRKSYCEYRCALLRDPARVADEMGNSVAMIRRHYLAALEGSDELARQWFSVEPLTEGGKYVQVNFGGL